MIISTRTYSTHSNRLSFQPRIRRENNYIRRIAFSPLLSTSISLNYNILIEDLLSFSETNREEIEHLELLENIEKILVENKLNISDLNKIPVELLSSLGLNIDLPVEELAKLQFFNLPPTEHNLSLQSLHSDPVESVLGVTKDESLPVEDLLFVEWPTGLILECPVTKYSGVHDRIVTHGTNSRQTNDFFANVNGYKQFALFGDNEYNYDPSGDNFISDGGMIELWDYDSISPTGGFRFIQRVVPTGTNARNANDQFAYSISIDTGIIAVGSPFHGFDVDGADNKNNAGACWQFTYNSNEIIQQKKIVPTGTNARNLGDEFGFSLSCFGNDLCVGAHQHEFDQDGDNLVTKAGAAWVFEKTSTSGLLTQKQKIVPTGTNARNTNDNFGHSVSLASQTLACSADTHDYDADGDNSLANAGAVWIFTKTTGLYSQHQKIVTSDRSNTYFFGRHVQLLDDFNLFVSDENSTDANGENSLSSAGALWHFSRSNLTGLFEEKQKIVPNGTNARNLSDKFASAFYVNGDYRLGTGIICGSSAHNYDQSGLDSVTSAGAVWFFEYNGSVFVQKKKVVAEGVNARNISDNFGGSVFWNEQYCLIAAKGHNFDSSGQNDVDDAGAVWVYTSTVAGKDHIPIEHKLDFVDTESVPVENLSGILQDDKVPVENLLGILQDDSVPTESLSGILRDNSVPAESLSGILQDDSIPTEDLLFVEWPTNLILHDPMPKFTGLHDRITLHGTGIRASQTLFAHEIAIYKDFALFGHGTFNGRGMVELWKYDGVSPTGGFKFIQRVIPTGTNASVGGDTFGGEYIFGRDGSTNLAIDSGVFVVGAANQDYDATGGNLKSNAGAAWQFNYNDNGVTQQQKLVPVGLNARNALDRFGRGLSMHNNELCIGAPQQDYDSNGSGQINDAGAVWIFEKTSTTGLFAQKQKIRPTGLIFVNNPINIGKTTSLFNRTLAIGGPGSNLNRGAVWVFTKTSDTGLYSQHQRIRELASEQLANNNFGARISLSDDFNLFIYSAQNPYTENLQDGVLNAGCVWHYSRSSLTGLFDIKQKIFPTGVNARKVNDIFGYSMYINTDYPLGTGLIAGSNVHDYDVSGQNFLSAAGAFWVFDYDGNRFTQRKKIVASGKNARNAGDEFAVNIAWNDKFGLASAYKHNYDSSGGNPFNNAGAVFTYSATELVKDHILTEHKLDLSLSESIPEENLSGIAPQITIPIENLSGILGINSIPIENLLNISDVNTILTDHLLSLGVIENLPVENTRLVDILRKTPVELVSEISPSQIIPVELLLSLTDTTTVSVETLLNLSLLDSIPTELLSTFLLSSSCPIENLGQLIDFKRFPVESLSNIFDLNNIPTEFLTGIKPISDLPIEHLRFLSSIDSIPIETLLEGAVVIFNSIPVEHLLNISDINKVLIEHLLLLGITDTLPIENLTGILGVNSVSVELLSGILSSPSCPIETIGQLLNLEKIPIENLSNIFDLSDIPTEFLAGVKPISDLPIEYLRFLSSVDSIPTETLLEGAIVIFNSIPVEHLLNISDVNKVLIEHLLSLGITHSLSIEDLAGILGTNSISIELLSSILSSPSCPIETLGELINFEKFPVESLSSIFDLNKIPIEFLAGVKPIFDLPVEHLVFLSNIESIPIETLLEGAITIFSNIPIEHLLSLSLFDSLPLSSLSFLDILRKYPTEILSGINIIDNNPVESLQSIFDLNNLPTEVLLALAQIKDIPIESLLGLNILPSLPIENLQSLDKLVSIPVEKLSSLFLSNQFPVENLSNIQANYLTPIEHLLTVASTQSVPIEHELQGAIVIPVSIPIETLLSVNLPQIITIDTLVELGIVDIIPIESLSRLVDISSLPIETQIFTEVVVIKSTPAEILSKLNIDPSIPIEIIGVGEGGKALMWILANRPCLWVSQESLNSWTLNLDLDWILLEPND